MRHLCVRVLVVALAVMAGATAASAQTSTTSTTAPPEPGLGIRLTEVPAERQDDPRARSYIIDHVGPGATVERTVEVSNGTDGTLSVTLYAGPATVEDGAFVFGDPGVESELTAWVSIDPATMELGAGQRAEAVVTIEVPPDATAGERYGVVWAETPGAPPEGGGVAVNSRVGIRLYLSVGPGGEPGTDFSLDTFQPALTDGGTPAVVIEACNGGGRAVDLTGEVELSDGPGGTSAGPFETAGARTFAPDECGEVVVEMAEGLPDGPWKATARLQSGEIERTASATITFPDEPGRGDAVATERLVDSGTGRFALLLALLALAAVIAGTAVLVRRRRRSLGSAG